VSVPIPHVKPEECFLVRRIGPRDYRFYRCLARYGYCDIHKDDLEFERDLMCSIPEFFRSEKREQSVAIMNRKEDRRCKNASSISILDLILYIIKS